jgi:hypothetical protein
LVNFTAIWYFNCHFDVVYGHLAILCPFWHFCVHFGIFVSIFSFLCPFWHFSVHFSIFGLLCREKSGNPFLTLFGLYLYVHTLFCEKVALRIWLLIRFSQNCPKRRKFTQSVHTGPLLQRFILMMS